MPAPPPRAFTSEKISRLRSTGSSLRHTVGSGAARPARDQGIQDPHRRVEIFVAGVRQGWSFLVQQVEEVDSVGENHSDSRPPFRRSRPSQCGGDPRPGGRLSDAEVRPRRPSARSATPRTKPAELPSRSAVLPLDVLDQDRPRFPTADGGHLVGRGDGFRLVDRAPVERSGGQWCDSTRGVIVEAP